MKPYKKLEKSLDKKWCIRFETEHPDGDVYDGIVTNIGSDFVAIREMDDLELDGMQIFPHAALAGFRDGKYEKTANEIIRFNGEIGKLETPEWLDQCETVVDVIKALHKNDIWPGIEIVYKDNSASFYLGPIVKVRKKSFDVDCYDATGKWEGEYKISYDEIFRIVIENRYCRNFNAYMSAQEIANDTEDAPQTDAETAAENS